MSDIDKIKQLFATQDINNHKLGYILAKNTLLMSDEEIIRLIVEDWNGWYREEVHKFAKTYTCFVKHIFNDILDITLHIPDNEIVVYGFNSFRVNLDITFPDTEDVFYKEITSDFKYLIKETFKYDSTSSN